MGPLAGVKIVELAGIGPGPMCAMLLADMGADVVRVDRTEASGLGMGHNPKGELRNRSRPNVAVNLKTPEGVETLLRLIDQADGLIEGYRPGVMERLGLGPDVCLKRNPKLIFGRMTGWGQDGPLAHVAGHDINYISIVGALHAIGPKGGPPVPPLNLVGDFGGGGLYLAMGLLAGIIEARVSGKGQVIDCAMTEGAASLMTMFYGMKAMGHGAMAAPAATDAQLAEGLVKKVDKATGKVTLTHGPLSNGMPGMTMAFKVKDAAWLEQMKAGQTIRFALDGAMTVVRFEAVK